MNWNRDPGPGLIYYFLIRARVGLSHTIESYGCICSYTYILFYYDTEYIDTTIYYCAFIGNN